MSRHREVATDSPTLTGGAASVALREIEHRFGILGVELTLSGPAPIVEPIAYAYRRFEAVAPVAEGRRRLRVALTGPRTMTVDGREVPFVPGPAAAVQFYQRFQAALMDAVDSLAVLHAAALDDDRGAAFLLAGPSGHGKTSLTLELARRGHGFLSDDIAPLDLARGLVAPYPRAVAVVPGSSARVPEPFLTESHKPGVTRWLDKTLLDVGFVLGEAALVARPEPLRHVFLLLSGSDGPPAATLATVTTRAEDAGELDALLDRTPGAEVLARHPSAEVCSWRIRLDHALRPTSRLAEFFDGDRVVLFEKEWDERPDFTGSPEASRVRKREAAELLAREMLNRRRNSAFLARFGGSAARIFMELAGSLRDAECWRIRVGGCSETADLIQDLTGSG